MRVCSTVARAQRLIGEVRVRDPVGGLHLLDPPDARLEATVSFLASLAPSALHSRHCTDLGTRCALFRAVP